MKKLITVAFLTLLLLTQAFAQKTTTKGVEIEYDKIKDMTTISVMLPLSDSLLPGENIVFGSLDVFKGKIRTTPVPEKVIVTFISISKKKQFSGSRSWSALADEERIKLGDGEYVVEANSGGVAEVLLYALSIENLKKIVDAKQVEMQVGNREFTLSELQMVSLREYYKKLNS
jgi:hypothetical protein